MPELLDPQQAQKVMVALPGSGARPVSQGAPQRPPAPAAPPSPFKLAAPGGSPRILLLPHEESASSPSASPSRQADDREAVRLARSITPVRLSAADHDAFLNAIADKPNDAAPRLVYADYLDERGHPHLATALRQSAAFTPLRLSAWAAVAKALGRHAGVPGLKAQVSLVRSGGGLGGVVSLWPRGQRSLTYDTTDLDHLRGLMSEFGPDPIPLGSNPDAMGYAEAHDRVRGLLGMPSVGESVPERFAATQAPPGTGAIIRGVVYKPGQFAPKELTEAHPTPTQAAPPARRPARDRLKAALASHRAPVRNSRADGDGLYQYIRDNPHDMAPRLVYADWLDEQGRSEDAAAHRRLAALYPHGQIGYNRSPLNPALIRTANETVSGWPPLADHLAAHGLLETARAMRDSPPIPSPYDRTRHMGEWEPYRYRSQPPYSSQVGHYLFAANVETPGDASASLYHEIITHPNGTGVLRVKIGGGLDGDDSGARYFALSHPRQVKALLEEMIRYGRKGQFSNHAHVLDELIHQHPSDN